MNLVDSSGWLEYFSQGPNAGFFAPVIEGADELVVPTICLYEVYKQAARQRGQEDAQTVVAGMRRGIVVDLTESIALFAAETSILERLPMADSIILATARMFDATVWSQDADFEGRTGVRYVRKKAIIQERRSRRQPHPG